MILFKDEIIKCNKINLIKISIFEIVILVICVTFPTGILLILDYFAMFDNLVVLEISPFLGVSLFLLIFYLSFNKKKKNQLRDLGIKVNKRWYEHWASDEYSYRLEQDFYRNLIYINVLSGNMDEDVERLNDYILYFKESKEELLTSPKFKILTLGLTLYVVSFAVVSTYLFNIPSEFNIIEKMKFFALAVFVSCFIIFGLVYWQNFMYWIDNKLSRKYNSIARRLTTLRINIKYNLITI